MTKPTPNAVDVHVGARIRQRRLLADKSQDVLAHAIGVTFQQVQKYERGANRISASRIYAVACALGTPVSWFFEGLTGDAADQAAITRDLTVDSFLSSREGRSLALHFQALKPRHRRQLAALVAAMAEGSDQQAA
ncbi:transcriptional regulator [Caulobacter flavus]|uniref:Transcriptional regulator n=1 Tax=Caulobacter flavus TaxID=1679497 RepID=A0A2N5CP94_9CAUL|nr:helix-turn-helix transcriptional regulator [Caulobacter flavus]AYV48514.1 transcriptional regulator [Caulobacter flavus]PLR08771.1 transcriptional regulator [Caulobacter flavus]